MRKLMTAMAVAGAIGAGLSGAAQAAPASGAIGDAAATLSIVDQAQYIYGGHRHCWYPNGWHGAGWYRCGYANRVGYGWGGVGGWNGWAAPGVVVAAPAPVVVVPAPYFWNGRRYHHRRWYHGHWVYY